MTFRIGKNSDDFVTFNIERNRRLGVALVTVVRATWNGQRYDTTTLEEYETASSGATASGRKAALAQHAVIVAALKK